jgi:hypothetical protein
MVLHIRRVRCVVGLKRFDDFLTLVGAHRSFAD